jgi:outer membrane protein TolC
MKNQKKKATRRKRNNFIKKMHYFFKNIFLLSVLLSFSFSEVNSNETNALTDSNVSPNLSFSGFETGTGVISEDEYFSFIRDSIITQPEFLYANSNYIEKNQTLKFSKRQRWPEISTRIINDHILDRSIEETSSIRKRQDDSFDAVIEISQPLYSGGSINAQIRKSIADKNLSFVQREDALSKLILDANRIYLSAVKSYSLYNYSNDIIREIEPYLDKVKERVELGISDPILLALFSIKYNSLKSKVQILKANMNRDVGVFEYFFNTKFENAKFPNIFVNQIEMSKDTEGYDVEASKILFESAKEDTNLVKGEFRPKFGFNTRYTVYDLDEKENDSDIRGGIFFSMPIFTFGRATAKIAASKAKTDATRLSIDIEKKNDDVKENEVVNLVKSAFNTRNEIFSSLNDTKDQRRIIKNRLDSTNFSPENYVTSCLEEINLLDQAISIEISMIEGYLSYLHQNQRLNNYMRIKL